MKKQELVARVAEKLASHSAVNVPLVVAVSGGPDSMVLLDILRQLIFPINLVVVHVNHRLRKSAGRDQKLVENYCAQYGLKLAVRQVKLKKGGSVEENARDERYKALRDEARKNKAAYIVVAHTADDQAETVLFNLVRGAGLRGLGGMRELTDNLLRPLLDVTKAELLSYARASKLAYAKDETNDSLEFTRNIIRHKLIPQLAKLNPNVAEQLVVTSKNIQNAEEAVRALARLHVAAMATAKVGTLELPISKLLELTSFMRAEVIKFAAELLGLGYKEWSVAQFAQIDKLLASPEANASKRLGKLLVQKRYDKISISLI